MVILRAEGRGFNAGVDIKEMQNTEGFTRADRRQPRVLRGVPAVYECAVPSSRPSTASASAAASAWSATPTSSSRPTTPMFGLPEVDRGALGAATHLARLVPQHMMRTLYFTAATVDAPTLTIRLRATRWSRAPSSTTRRCEVAGEIAAKDTRVIRRAKEALNRIDPVDVQASYRFEQGFTFELNLSGVVRRAPRRVRRTGKAENDRRELRPCATSGRRSTRSSASCGAA